MDDLARKIREGKVILFVGAGVSATLKLPTWSQLMDEIASRLAIDRDIFSLYGDPLTLAEYYILEKGTIGSLRSWMDVNWNVDETEIRASEIYQIIARLNFPIIYTTNFDRCLEKSYHAFGKAFTKVSKVEDICECDNNKAQIIKFHGDFDDDESIVLTESSYFDRMDFESPLDIKLRSDILGKSLLFIGYSLSDINMRYMIYKLNRMWENKRLRPISYIFMTAPNPVQERVLLSRSITPVIGTEVNPTESLRKFLKELAQRVGV